RRVHHYCCSAANRRPTHTGDKGTVLCSLDANAYFPGLARNPGVANLDIVIARGQVIAGLNTKSNVIATGCVVKKRKKAASHVVVAGCVEMHRFTTSGCVSGASYV